MRIANKNAREYVQRNEPFQGSNMFGLFENHCEFEPTEDSANWTQELIEWKQGRPYVVYSYGTHFPMFIYLGNSWYENSDKYSTSTSRQQSQAHPNEDTIKKTTKEMKELLQNIR
tara:strand:+ start:230 stop:574 length:345 start_codon:yes stop_codon:yes gene_type:complete